MKRDHSFPMLLLATLFTLVPGCRSSHDVETMRSEILALHKAMIDAHWEKNVGYFDEALAEDYISVSEGEISHPTSDDIRAMFSDYLGSTTFTEYRDVSEPIIGFSDDGSLAWSVVQVKVAGTRVLDDGIERELDFTCAWLTVYEREGDSWLRRCEISTFK